ncbi:ABC transporter permease [Salinadaptatus halalkaliphilus]|uniref:ABC transporter permease n=1 Tax=Salinadaptatus halalkaliphilus TaxID=2419781 RepID=A0A4S3TN42_9EURY|nr:ABC transporter permease [Salinadaptatus halalkaliphilus]THE65672.1 ABC transporter permease [Salinadaptatus halalkaliphilus]
MSSASSPGDSSDAGRGESEPVPQRASGNGFWGDTRCSLERWLRKTARSPFVTFSSLVQPVLFFVLLAAVLGAVADGALSQAYGDDVRYVTFLTPAIVIQSALAAAAVSGIGLVKDVETGMFDAQLASPIDRRAMILGKTLSELCRIAVQTAIILALGYAMLWYTTGDSVGSYHQTGVLGLLGIVAIAVCFGSVFVAFSTIVALVTRDEEATILIANLLTFPLLFVSSAFLPLEVLPGWIRTVAVANPVTYGVDGIRALMLGEDVLTVLEVSGLVGYWNAVVPAVAVLSLCVVALGAIATTLLRRAWRAEVR